MIDGDAHAMKMEVKIGEKGWKNGFVGAKNARTSRPWRGVEDAVLGRVFGCPEDGWEGWKWPMVDGDAHAMKMEVNIGEKGRKNG